MLTSQKITVELIAQMTSKENNFPSSFSSTKNPLKKTLSLLTVGINVAKFKGSTKLPGKFLIIKIINIKGL